MRLASPTSPARVAVSFDAMTRVFQQSARLVALHGFLEPLHDVNWEKPELVNLPYGFALFA